MSETYRRLPGRSYGLFGNYSIWAGTDHLLSVESRRFIESYRRFYYNDIQAIQICERNGIGLPLEVVLGLAIVFLLAATSRHYWLAIVAVPAAVLYVWDKLRGQRCSCSVRTATGTWPLPALSRTKSARACLEALRPSIESAQGVIDVDAALEAGGVLQFVPSAAPPQESGLAFMWPLFAITLISAALAWYDATHPVTAALASAEWLLAFSVITASVLALVLFRNPSSGGPRVAAVSILILQSARVLVAAVQFFIEATATAVRAQGGPAAGFDSVLSEMKMTDNGIQVISALAALAGIFTLLIHPRKGKV